MTVRQKDVEKVFCPSPGAGKAKVADLTDRHPAFRNIRLRRVPRDRRRDHGPGELITMASTNQHAVVVGASIAGVLAAQVLAGHFERVTLVDRDEMPREPGPRGGVPQGRHVHGLLSRGREVVEEMFPGTTADLVARGAILGDALADGRYFFGPRPLAQTEAGLPTLAVSRPLLEWYLRHRLLHDTRVSVLEHTSVLDLAFSADDARVDGRRS